MFAEASGFEVEDHFSALGGDWMLTKSAKPLFAREMKRLHACLRRLERARYLPLKPERLAPVISTGWLSLLDFVNLPTHQPYKPVATMVKACFGVVSGAPEVIYHVLASTSLDPIVRWLLSGLRLWLYALREEPSEEFVTRIAQESKGRLGSSARMALKMGIEVTHRGFLVADRLVGTRELWSVCRTVILKHIRGEAAKRLAERRPAYFEGLTGFNTKQHLKALSEVDSYTSACYLKIWTGTIMTAARRALMGKGSAECTCSPLHTCSGNVLFPLLYPKRLSICLDCLPTDQLATSYRRVQMRETFRHGRSALHVPFASCA